MLEVSGALDEPDARLSFVAPHVMPHMRAGQMLIGMAPVCPMMMTILLTREGRLRECKRRERKNEETHNDTP